LFQRKKMWRSGSVEAWETSCNLKQKIWDFRKRKFHRGKIIFRNDESYLKCWLNFQNRSDFWKVFCWTSRMISNCQICLKSVLFFISKSASSNINFFFVSCKFWNQWNLISRINIHKQTTNRTNSSRCLLPKETFD